MADAPVYSERISRLLGSWAGGDDQALEELVPLVYNELHRLARRSLAGERFDHTLEPTALVHEAYLRLADGALPQWRDRVHFYAVAARVMRRILVDHARSRGAEKRGGGLLRVTLDRRLPAEEPEGSAELLALDRALEELATLDERKARVIDLRFFAGLTIDETARALGVSAPTVVNDTRFARAWLYDRIGARGRDA